MTMINTRIRSGLSRARRRRFTSIGLIIAPSPAMRPTFATVEPMMFPTANPAWPRNAAKLLTNNSGADVPNATTVSPTTRGLTPILAATLEEPVTSQSAPNVIATKPARKRSASVKAVVENPRRAQTARRYMWDDVEGLPAIPPVGLPAVPQERARSGVRPGRLL